jgi:hypothetical protein
MVIGNSFAQPLISGDRVEGELFAHLGAGNSSPTKNYAIADHSYLANAALWDSWYFSSLAPQKVEPYGSNRRGLQQVFDDFFPIGGVLGKEKFTLAPDSFEVVTPKPYQSGGRMYQSRFYCQINDQAKLFNDTHWPLTLSARVYLFFIPAPERQSIGYLAFREYEPFP